MTYGFEKGAHIRTFMTVMAGRKYGAYYIPAVGVEHFEGVTAIAYGRTELQAVRNLWNRMHK